MTGADVELPDVLIRIGYEGISLLINDAVITPEPLVSLPAEYSRKSGVS